MRKEGLFGKKLNKLADKKAAFIKEKYNLNTVRGFSI